MATGWAHEGAVLDQIEDTITDGVLTARARLPVGRAPNTASTAVKRSPRPAARPFPARGPA